MLLEALRWPTIDGVSIAPAPLALIRARAPHPVTSGATLDFRTLTPERGGLFDYHVFGPGTVIDAPAAHDDAPARARNVTFGRLVLGRPLPHPLFTPERHPDMRRARAEELATQDLVLHELAVLPPDLRPLHRLDDDRWQSTSVNDLYRRVIQRNDRLVKLIGEGAEPQLIDAEELAVHDALLALFDNERLERPVLDAVGQPLGSLQWLAGDVAVGLRAFAAKSDTARARKVEAVALGLGFALSR